jgi:mannose-1-phosphate guanylyltransferase
MAERFVVIIAGGRGERFWPESRAHRPKHLLPIVGEHPLLRQTLDRIRSLVPPRNTFVITSLSQEKGVRSCCRRLPAENVVVEPVGRDTGPAVALAATLVERRDPAGVFAILPADHVIHDAKAYGSDLNAAFAAAASADVLVTLGITPHEPATGFGYVHRGEAWNAFGGKTLFSVRRFVEKPSREVAEGYLASGEYLWNAGMFVWSVPSFTAALRQHAPDLLEGLEPVRRALVRKRSLARALTVAYPSLRKISIDYALLEKSRNVVVLPATFDWDDVGAWPAVARHWPADDRGNVGRGRVLVEDGSNNIVSSDDSHLVAVLGVSDCIVVRTKDATLVVPRARAQEIKTLLKKLETTPDGARWL